jgi:hypothetical protein
MKTISMLAMVLVLVAVFGFKCSTVQRNAACDDVTLGLSLASGEFPGDKVFAELKVDMQTICDVFRAGGDAKALLRAFVPRFDAFVNQHGHTKGLALIDIGVHVLLNHLFPSTPASTTALTGTPDDAVIEYRARAVWGCSFYPEKCAAIQK